MDSHDTSKRQSAASAAITNDLRAYYEEEARQGLRTSLGGRRLEVRNQFVDTLRREGRRSVLDFGAGPGLDAPGFTNRGIEYVGIDLAHGNGKLAGASNTLVLHASIDAPPFRAHSFDAGWSMSTLMHIPTADVPKTVAAMAGVLRPGAPLFVSLWGVQPGNTSAEHIDESHIEGHRRLFSLRTQARNRELFSSVGEIESEDTWDVGEDGWEYQVFQIRLPAD